MRTYSLLYMPESRRYSVIVTESEEGYWWFYVGVDFPYDCKQDALDFVAMKNRQ